ncbi:diguanylate cyclase [Halomonas glaciei]|uniref:Diguanylate cyclase n=1 Tax=Vreelandella glaciei TaxID=186761 RepID=A0A7Z0LT39_9GAMM|nr:diguanylate cyclase [Halomonas glaciei]
MAQSNRRLAMQAWLLILLTSSLLISVSSLLLDRVAHLPLPPQWRLSPDGTLAVLLVSVGLLALLSHQSRWRRLAGGLMIVLGGYSLGHDLLAPGTDDGLSWLTGQPRLGRVPALLVVIMGTSCFFSPASGGTRRGYRLIGWTSIILGVATLAYPLITQTPPVSVAGLTSMGSLFCLLLGAALLIIAHQRTYPTLPLPRSAIIVGVLGVTVSIMIWLASSWVQYNARLTAADTLVNNVADGMEQRIESRVKQVERLTERWMALRGEGRSAVRELQEVEMRTFMRDEPSLLAIVHLGDDSQVRWRVGREPANLLWMMDQLTGPATLGWLRQQNVFHLPISWRFPDPERSSHGLLAVTLDGGQTTMLAAIDLAEIIQLQRHLDTSGFTITYTSNDQTWGTLAAKSSHGALIPRAFASREVTLPGGPTFTITALDGPLSLSSLPGALPVIFGLMGLVFSYQLIMSRALIAFRNQQATALQLNEQRFRSLFTHNPDAVFAHHRDGTYESLNPVTEAIVGLSESDLLGKHFRSVVCEPACSNQDVERTEIAFNRAINGLPSSYTMRFVREGASQDLEVTMVPIVVDGEVSGVFGIAKDITDRVAAEERLLILERSLEASGNGAMIIDVRTEEKQVVYVNHAFTRITGYPEQEVIGHAPLLLSGAETDTEDTKQIQAAIQHGTSLTTTVRTYRRDGSPFWNQLFMSPVKDANQQVSHFICIINDISERKEQESQLAYQATHDVLTGLGNRALFSDRLAHDVELAARNGQTLAVLFVDLDEFKPINDTLGHNVGDQLLISVAEKLQQGLRVSDTLARLGGDEFVLLLPDLSHPDEAEEVAGRLLEALNKPHRINEHELHVSASIGIAVNRAGLDEPERLLQHADMAMYKAKQQGRNTYQMYTDDLDSKLSQRVTLRSELQEAIEHGHLPALPAPAEPRRRCRRTRGVGSLVPPDQGLYLASDVYSHCGRDRSDHSAEPLGNAAGLQRCPTIGRTRPVKRTHGSQPLAPPVSPPQLPQHVAQCTERDAPCT